MSIWDTHIHVQGMDNSHVGLYDLRLTSEWFDEYKTNVADTGAERIDICFDANTFHSILSIKNEDQHMVVSMSDTDPDHLKIVFKTGEEWKKTEYDKEFYMPLNVYDYEEMTIPTSEYDAEFSVSSKKITDTFSQLFKFGTEIQLNCNEERVACESLNGPIGAGMKVNIGADELNSYSIVEEETVQVRFSLPFLCKMCVCSHLSEEVDFCVSQGTPMKVVYRLDEGTSETSDNQLVYYVAPLVDDL